MVAYHKDVLPAIIVKIANGYPRTVVKKVIKRQINTVRLHHLIGEI